MMSTVGDSSSVSLGPRPWPPAPGSAHLGDPAFLAYPVPTGYIPPYKGVINYADQWQAGEMCIRVAAASCQTGVCMNGVSFAHSPFVPDKTSRLALDVGSPQFNRGMNLYNVCTMALAGWDAPNAAPNVFI